MNPDPPMKHDDRQLAKVQGHGALGMMERLLGMSGSSGARRGAREYPDAVPGSADPRRRRRAAHVAADGRVEHMPASGPGSVRRWQAEDGSLHRRRREAGPGAVLATIER